MSAVAVDPPSQKKASGQLNIALPLQEKGWVVGLFRILTAFSAWLLIGAHVLRPTFKVFGLPITFYYAVGVICFCAKVRGVKVFAKTPVDVAFVIWLALAVVSQLWASLSLDRVLMPDDITVYMSIILTNWLFFRAAFALCAVDPRTATGSFLKAIVFFLGFACLIGILQGYGPGGLKQWAIDFGVKNGAAGQVTLLQLDMSSPRPLALFSGPNYYGFMNLIAMTIIIGMTVAQGKNMSMRSVWVAALGIGLFMIGTIVAQSRFAIATSGILFLYFLWLMLKMGHKKVFATGIVAMGLMMVGGLYFVQSVGMTYLQSTFEKRVQDDASFRARERGLTALQDQAVALAPLGAGWDSKGYSIDRTGDVWSRTNSIDNGYLQAYINHGIPGVLQLLFLFCSMWWALVIAKRHEFMHIKMLRIIGGMVLLTYVFYSLSGTRHAKLETGIYWMVIFGLLYGSVYGEKYFGEDFRMRWRPIKAALTGAN